MCMIIYPCRRDMWVSYKFLSNKELGWEHRSKTKTILDEVLCKKPSFSIEGGEGWFILTLIPLYIYIIIMANVISFENEGTDCYNIIEVEEYCA